MINNKFKLFPTFNIGYHGDNKNTPRLNSFDSIKGFVSTEILFATKNGPIYNVDLLRKRNLVYDK